MVENLAGVVGRQVAEGQAGRQVVGGRDGRLVDVLSFEEVSSDGL